MKSSSGRTRNELVGNSTLEADACIGQEHEIIRLSREEQMAFVNALLNPSDPGVRLQKAVQNYRRKAEL